MVIWDKLLIILLSLGVIILSRRKISLSFCRTLFIFLSLIIAFFILLDDILQHDVSFSSGYLTILLLVVISCIPFKPWQAFTLCAGTTLILYPGLLIIPEYAGVQNLDMPNNQIIYLIIMSLILAGISTFLYHSRHIMYMARKKADEYVDSFYEPVLRLEYSPRLCSARVRREILPAYGWTPTILKTGSITCCSDPPGGLSKIPETSVRNFHSKSGLHLFTELEIIPARMRPSAGSLLRGYSSVRYIDNHLLSFQMEYRVVPLVWRLGFVAFAGIGEVFNRPDEIRLNHLKYNVGIGIRYVFSRSEKINIRFDYGMGRDSSGDYLDLNEAF